MANMRTTQPQRERGTTCTTRSLRFGSLFTSFTLSLANGPGLAPTLPLPNFTPANAWNPRGRICLKGPLSRGGILCTDAASFHHRSPVLPLPRVPRPAAGTRPCAGLLPRPPLPGPRRGETPKRPDMKRHGVFVKSPSFKNLMVFRGSQMLATLVQ